MELLWGICEMFSWMWDCLVCEVDEQGDCVTIQNIEGGGDEGGRDEGGRDEGGRVREGGMREG